MKFFKLVSGLAFVASIGALAGTWVSYQRYNAEHSVRISLESRQVQLEEQMTSLETQAAKIAPLEQELERLRGQIKDQVRQRDTLRKELDASYGQINALKKQIQNLEAEKKQLSEQLNVGQVTDSAIVREAAKIAVLPPAPQAAPVKTESNLSAEKQVKESPAPKAAKGVKPSEETKSVPTKEKEPPKAPSSPTQKVDQRPLQVLSVNRQFKFVVVNVGLRGNVKVGDTLRVEQGGKLIGRVQVEKLYENFSACNIVEEVKSAQIREGDLVRIA